MAADGSLLTVQQQIQQQMQPEPTPQIVQQQVSTRFNHFRHLIMNTISDILK